MTIKTLSATFGKLSNGSLAFKDGLNIIEAPNEAGKSTWCAFIKTMFYGLNLSERDKIGYLADKTRFRPWSGAPMEGAMDIEANGISLTLQRTSAGRQPMKEFSAVLTGTGEPYPGLYPDTAGETLLGVSEAVFERSAFIAQSGVRVTQTPELEKRISSLVTTGDETTSYTEADERLRQWQRKRQYKKSGGMIPALEERLAETDRKLRELEASASAASDIRLEGEQLRRQQKALQDELAASDRYAAQEVYRQALEKVGKAKDDCSAQEKRLAARGPLPDEREIAVIRGDVKALDTFQTMLDMENGRLDEAKKAYESAENTRRSAAGSSLTAEDASKAPSLEKSAADLSMKSPLSVLLMILSVLFAVLATVIPSSVRFACAALFIAGVIALAVRLNKAARLKKELAALLRRCHAASPADLLRLREEALRLAGLSEDARRDQASCEKSAASAQAAYDAHISELRRKFGAYRLGGDPDSAEKALLEIERLRTELAGARAALLAAENVLASLRESGRGTPESGPFSPAPSRPRGETAQELARTAAQLEGLASRYNMMLGEARALGDPVVLGSEKKALAEELAEQRRRFDALTLAVDTLRDANLELQSRFSPLLSETAGTFVRRLTGGRYEKLSFDKTLDASAKATGAAVSRGILSLSAGTADQIYLALRLAVCELVLPKDNPCPLILDDALANFDDARAALALDYLYELSKNRQILLFTCHSREAAHFSDGAVNVVRLT